MSTEHGRRRKTYGVRSVGEGTSHSLLVVYPVHRGGAEIPEHQDEQLVDLVIILTRLVDGHLF